MISSSFLGVFAGNGDATWTTKLRNIIHRSRSRRFLLLAVFYSVAPAGILKQIGLAKLDVFMVGDREGPLGLAEIPDCPSDAVLATGEKSTDYMACEVARNPGYQDQLFGLFRLTLIFAIFTIFGKVLIRCEA